MVTYTTVLNLSKPDKACFDWDDEINSNFDAIDSIFSNEHNANGTHKLTVSGSNVFSTIHGNPNLTIDATILTLSGIQTDFIGDIVNFYPITYFYNDIYLSTNIVISGTVITAADLKELTDGSVTTLHSHGGMAVDHSTLTGLNWSSAGHTFDENVDIGSYDLKAQSFSIGTNTLSGTEWAYLDNQDQEIKTTSIPTFSGIDFPSTDGVLSPSIDKIRLFAVPDNNFVVLETVTDLGVRNRINQDTFRIVRNATDDAIQAAKAVYFTGSTGNKPNFDLAKADSELTMPAIGITTAIVPKDSYGEVMIVGRLLNVKTDYSGWAEGDQLYVDPVTPGELTNIRPLHPNLAQRIGTIEVVHSSNGVILINCQPLTGIEDGTNRNIYTIGNTLAGDKILIFDGAADGSIVWNGTNFIFGSDIVTSGTITVEGTTITVSGTTVSGTQLATLTDGSNADALHAHTVVTTHSGLSDMPSADNTDHDGRFYTKTELGSTVSGTSGASLIGVFDEFVNTNAANVQDVLKALDGIIATVSGSYVKYPNVLPVGSGTFIGVDHYDTIADAIAYIDSLPIDQAPALGNEYLLLLYPQAFNEDIPLRDFVSYKGVATVTRIRGNDTVGTTIVELGQGGILSDVTIDPLVDKAVGVAIPDCTMIQGIEINSIVSGTLIVNGVNTDPLNDETFTFTTESTTDDVVTTILATTVNVYAYNRLGKLAIISKGSDSLIVYSIGTANAALGFSISSNTVKTRGTNPIRYMSSVSILGKGVFSVNLSPNKLDTGLLCEDAKWCLIALGLSVSGANNEATGKGIVMKRGFALFGTVTVTLVIGGGTGMWFESDGYTQRASPIIGVGLLSLNSTDLGSNAPITVTTVATNTLKVGADITVSNNINIHGVTEFENLIDPSYDADSGSGYHYHSKTIPYIPNESGFIPQIDVSGYLESTGKTVPDLMKSMVSSDDTVPGCLIEKITGSYGEINVTEVLSPIIVRESCDDASSWTVLTGITPTDDTSEKVEGTGSINCGGAYSIFYYKTVSTFDVTNDNIYVYIYVDSSLTIQSNSISLFYEDSSGNFRGMSVNTNTLSTGWNLLGGHYINDWTSVSFPPPDYTNIVKFEIIVSSSTGIELGFIKMDSWHTGNTEQLEISIDNSWSKKVFPFFIS